MYCMPKYLTILLLLYSTTVVHADTEKFEREFSVKAGGQLVVDKVRGPVRIHTWNENKVKLVVRPHNGSQQDLNDRLISVKQENSEIKVGGGNGQSQTKLNYQFRIPENFNINIDTKEGSISVSDRIVGRAFVDTSGGSIDISEVDGDLNADSSGGSISVGKVSGVARLDTAGGSITLNHGGQKVSADTSGGSIKIGPSNGDVDADTSGGSITIGYAKGNVTADTSGGSIRLSGSDGNASADTAGGSITISNVAGRIEAATNGGGIKISGAGGAIEAETNAGTIVAELVQANPVSGSALELSTNHGSITLSLPASLAATIDAELRGARHRGGNSIDSDFPLDIAKTGGSITARGDINGGGVEINLEASNGTIRIQKLDR